MPNFKKSPAGGPSAMKMYGKGKNPIMRKETLPGIITDKKAPTKMYGKAAPVKNYKKGYYGA